MKPTKAEIAKWTKALRSGQYKQTREYLQNDAAFCCLGVACKVFIPTADQLLREDGTLSGSLPMTQPNAPKFLIRIDSDFYQRTDQYLTALNDRMDFTFDEIADLLEAVYIHEVLA